jgi:hypothetical protein
MRFISVLLAAAAASFAVAAPVATKRAAKFKVFTLYIWPRIFFSSNLNSVFWGE